MRGRNEGRAMFLDAGCQAEWKRLCIETLVSVLRIQALELVRGKMPKGDFAKKIGVSASEYSTMINKRCVSDDDWRNSFVAFPELDGVFTQLALDTNDDIFIGELHLAQRNKTHDNKLFPKGTRKGGNAALSTALCGCEQSTLLESELTANASNPALAEVYREVTWRLARSVHRLLDACGVVSQVVITVVGAQVDGESVNAAVYPLIWAATGFTHEPLDGPDGGTLSQFTEANMFPQPPPNAAPAGDRTIAPHGLVVGAWRHSENHDRVPSEPFDLDDETGYCACYDLSASHKSELRDIFLSFSESTQIIYIFRAFSRRNNCCLVVGLDFMDDRRICDDERAWIFRLTLDALKKVANSGRPQQ